MEGEMPVLKPSYEKVAMALADGQSTRLAVIAGGFKFSPGSAYRISNRADIKARVIEIRKERHDLDRQARQVAAQESGVDLGWIERHAKILVLGALRGDLVRDSSGRRKTDPETGELIYRPDRAAAAKGLEILGRMKGAFIDRTEIGNPGDFSRLQDVELDAKIAELARAAGLPEDAVLLIEDMSNRQDAAE